MKRPRPDAKAGRVASTLPLASLSNVTHTDNHKIQRAYAASGRMHLADTVVLRRVLQS